MGEDGEMRRGWGWEEEGDDGEMGGANLLLLDILDNFQDITCVDCACHVLGQGVEGILQLLEVVVLLVNVGHPCLHLRSHGLDLLQSKL